MQDYCPKFNDHGFRGQALPMMLQVSTATGMTVMLVEVTLSDVFNKHVADRWCCIVQRLHAQLDRGNLDPREADKARAGQRQDYPDGIEECGTDALRFALISYTTQVGLRPACTSQALSCRKSDMPALMCCVLPVK